MANRHTHTKAHNNKNAEPKKFKKNEEDYRKNLNKTYYQATKDKRHENDKTTKNTLINYYKRLLGEEFVLNVLLTYGLELGLEKIKQHRNENKPSVIRFNFSVLPNENIL